MPTSTPSLEVRLREQLAQVRSAAPGASEQLRVLLSEGALPAQDDEGFGLAHLFAAAGLAERLKEALFTGTLDAASRPCSAGMPPLGYALLSGSRETAEVMLTFWSRLPETVPFRGEQVPLLALAVVGNCRGVVQRLAWKGAPLDARWRGGGMDLLRWAEAWGRAELLGELQAARPARLFQPVALPEMPPEPLPEAVDDAPVPGLLVLEDAERQVWSFDLDAVAVGRLDDNDLILGDDAVSRHHARLLRLDGAWYLEDRRSSNGSHVNEEEISRITQLRNGDVLRLGHTSLTVYLGKAALVRQARGQLRLISGDKTPLPSAPVRVRGGAADVCEDEVSPPVPGARVDESRLPTPLACAVRAARRAQSARGAQAAVMRALHACLDLLRADADPPHDRPGLRRTMELFNHLRFTHPVPREFTGMGVSAWLDWCDSLFARLLLEQRRTRHGHEDPVATRLLLEQLLHGATWLEEVSLVYVVSARKAGAGFEGEWIHLSGTDPLGDPRNRAEVTWGETLTPGQVYLRAPWKRSPMPLPSVRLEGGVVGVMDGLDSLGRCVFSDALTGAPVPSVAGPHASVQVAEPPRRRQRPSFRDRDGAQGRTRVGPAPEREEATPAKVERFTCSPGCVRDNRTGLTWQRHVPATRMTLEEARAYARDLELEGSGWRLPTREELLGLVDLSRRSPAVDPEAFPGTPSAGAWAEGDEGTPPWVVHFGTGVAASGVETDGWFVRCVR